MNQFNQFENINFFIGRDNTYNTKGRMQTLEEAKAIDVAIYSLLNENNIPYYEVPKETAVEEIFNEIMRFL